LSFVPQACYTQCIENNCPSQRLGQWGSYIKTSVNYRPDIDGLRAVAVALVIAYHFVPAAIPAGFVGVDVFFVISGFVVTRSVQRAETGNWPNDILSFWRRRFLRIFPPLALMIGCVSVAAQVFIPPFPLEPYNANARTAVAALFGFSNIYLNRVGLDYFASSDTNLFLHTWSLGVEEQFYIAFAIIFIALFPAIRAVKFRFAIIAILAAISLLLCTRAALTEPSAAYYFLQYRFWEIAAGSLLALGRLVPLPRAAGWFAVMALAVSGMHHFGGGLPLANLLIAAGATALLIWSGETHPIPILVTRPFVYTGLISYALYLWHWPFAVFAKITIGDQSLGITVATILTFVAAFASYHLVEKRWRGRSNIATAGLLVGALGIVATAMASVAAFRPGLMYIGSQQLWMQEWRIPESYRVGSITIAQCQLNDGSAVPARIPTSCSTLRERTVIVLGDSQASAAWGMFDDAVKSGSIGIASLAFSGCGLQNTDHSQAASCLQYWNSMPNYIRQIGKAGDVIFLATAWHARRSVDLIAAERIHKMQAAAESVGASFIVQTALPTFKRPSYLCTKEWFRSDFHGCSEALSEYRLRKRPISAAIERLGVTVWDPESSLCNRGYCRNIENGKPIFRDYTHLSTYGSHLLGPYFLAQIGFVNTHRRPAH
jgi:peptidoglycan/LPS O-acetylase OafA/YrhL